MSVPVKVFTGLKKAQNITEHMINHEIIDVIVTTSSKFDELVQKCSVHCGIKPMYASLFAIWDARNKVWTNLGNDIFPLQDHNGMAGEDTTAGCTFEFRIRFLMKTETTVNGQKGESQRYDASRVMDKVIVEYLYRQRRDDFLFDNIALAPGTDADDDSYTLALGVAALDLLCLSQISKTKLQILEKRVPVKRLLSKSFRNRLRHCGLVNRWQIKVKFKHFVRYLIPVAQRWEDSGHDLDLFLRRYLLNLELFTATYGVERYDLATKGYITVSADNGITLHGDGKKEEKWCDFSEITHMTLQVRSHDDTGSVQVVEQDAAQENVPQSAFIVNISKLDGTCKTFSMNSGTSAENLASCIDGYYRLLVDAHHYLCKGVCSTDLVQHIRLKCHGPITCGYAEKLLQERHKLGVATVGDCVIRKSRENWDEYFVNSVLSVDPFKTGNYKMDRSDDNLLGLYGWQESHKHENLESLLEECAEGRHDNRKIPINKSKILAPKPKHKSNLIVRLSRDSLIAIYPTDDQQIGPRAALIELDANAKQNVNHLGTGAFTIVKRYKNENTGRCMVFKSILEQNEPQQNHHIHTSFQDSTALLNRISHRHFVQHLGMTMSHVTGIWLEYLPLKSITQYLESRNLELRNSPAWFLHALWQVTHACHYLEEMGLAHGNLRGKNILLQCDAPQPHVKISDSGVRTRRRVMNDGRVAKTSIVDPMLPAPWLAYEFCFRDRSSGIKYPTIEADKWSYGATVCEILNWGKIRLGPVYGGELHGPMRQFYQHGDLRGCLGLPELITGSQELCDLITACWSVAPDQRPPFQKILREIGSILTGGYVLLSVASEPIVEAVIELDLDVPTYEDEKLTRISILGAGRYGTVELSAYDRHRNTLTEKVAIKEPKDSSSMKQHNEFIQEIETMKRTNLPYVVRLLGVTEPSGRIVMEYLKNGSLADFMRRRRNEGNWLPTSQLLRYCSQIAEGMTALQEMRLVHRDLALRNILLADNPSYIKISDFGLSRFVREDREYYSGIIDHFPAFWYAPECLRPDLVRSFGFESDVWSYGITVWELFTYGDFPCHENLRSVSKSEIADKLRRWLEDDGRLPQTVKCPDEVYKMMHECWAYDKLKRWKFDKIKAECDRLVPLANANQLTYTRNSEG